MCKLNWRNINSNVQRLGATLIDAHREARCGAHYPRTNVENKSGFLREADETIGGQQS